jgi:hypothetical protein
MRLPTQRSEARLCTLLLGAIQLYWSVLPLVGGDFRLSRMLDHFSQKEEWFVVMGFLGLLMMISAVTPWRSMRQLSQFLSCASWFGFFGMWLTYYAETGRWIVSPVAMTAPLFGLFCFLLFVNDVLQKPSSTSKGVE